MSNRRKKTHEATKEFIENNKDEEYEKEVKKLIDYVNITEEEVDKVRNSWTGVMNARQAFMEHNKINPTGSETKHAAHRMQTLANEMWNTVNHMAFNKDDSESLFDSVTSRAQAAALYNYSGVARNIIDIPITDSLKDYKLECAELDEEQMEELNNEIKSLDLFGHVKKAVTYADLWGGGAIIPKIKGYYDYGMTDSVMLRKVKPGFIEQFTTIDHWRLTPVKYKGLPSIWSPDVIVTQYYTGNTFEDGFNIHESRMSKVYRPYASTLGVTSSTYTGFGISIYNLMKRQILNYERSVNLLFQMLLISSRTFLEPNENFYNHDGGNAGTRDLGGTGNAALSQTDPNVMLQQINRGMDVVNGTDSLNARYLGAFKLVTHDKTFSGVGDAIDALKGSLSANSGIDRERLFSDDPAGFNSGENRNEIWTSKKKNIWDFAKPAMIKNIQLVMYSLFKDEIEEVTLQKAMQRLNVLFEGEEKTMRMLMDDAGILDILEIVDRKIIPLSSAHPYLMEKIKGMDYVSPEFEEEYKERLKKLDILDLHSEEGSHDLIDEAMGAAESGDTSGAEDLTKAAQDVTDSVVENSLTLRNGKEFPLMDAYFFQGLPIKVENKRGSVRKGEANGKSWENLMDYDYGFISGTQGVDGDGVDVYVGPESDSDRVFVIKQRDIGVVSEWTNGECPDCESHATDCNCPDAFDEDKVMLGFLTEDAAKAAYLAQYDNDLFLGPVLEMSIDDLKDILDGADGRSVNIGNSHFTEDDVLSCLQDDYEKKLISLIKRRGGSADDFHRNLKKSLGQE